MQLTVKGKNTTVPEKVRTRAERKLAKLERFDNRILAVDVEFSEERNPRVADPHRVEVTLTTRSGLVRAHANAIDPAAAVDQVIDRLERQVKKLKGRRVDRTQHAEGVKAIPPLPPEPLGDASTAPRSLRSMSFWSVVIMASNALSTLCWSSRASAFRAAA